MGKLAFDHEPHLAGVRFTIGRDAGGRWVVIDRDGLVGGLFADRNSAVRFAMFESDHMPGAVCCAPDTETLSLGTGFENRPATRPVMTLVGRG